MSKNTSNKLFDASLVKEAIQQSFIKLNPRIMFHNPVMFTVEIGTAVMLGVCIWIMSGEKTQGSLAYNLIVFTVLLDAKVRVLPPDPAAFLTVVFVIGASGVEPWTKFAVATNKYAPSVFI